MIQSLYELDHPARTRMANSIGRHLSGTDKDNDAVVMNQLVTEDGRILADLLNFLLKVGTIRTGDFPVSSYRVWCARNEATWMNEWKKWSSDVKAD